MIVLDKIGEALAAYLTRSRHIHGASHPPTAQQLLDSLRPADVLLVEGNSRVSLAIKYLTQSTWSHAALYIGSQSDGRAIRASNSFVEADLVDGVRLVGVDTYAGLNARICRPVGLTESERDAVGRFAIERLGYRYDLKNIFDLARYLLPNPPVPTRWRRRMIALGSGDPTRAICSTLIAQAFQSVRYPILPHVDFLPGNSAECPVCAQEILSIRHHSLFAPRDFDVSPYFEIVKPTIGVDFDFHCLQWAPM